MVDRVIQGGAQEQAQQKERSAIQRGHWLVAAGLAVLLMGLIIFVHHSSPRTLVSFHGFIHIAIAQEFLSSIPLRLPPENPFFAGQPVIYYWFFQFLGARLAQLFGWNVLFGMEVLIVLGAGVLIAACIAIGRRLFRSTGVGAAIAFLVLAGTNPFGWIFSLYKLQKYGLSVLQDDPNHLWGVVHPIFSLARFNDIGGLYGPLINFFFNITSRPISLALVAVSVLVMWQLFERRSIRWAVLLTLLSALTTAFNPIIGIFTSVALVAGVALIWAWGAAKSLKSGRKVSGTFSFRNILVLGIIEFVGLLIALPTYLNLFSGVGGGHIYFSGLSTESLRYSMAIAIGIFPLAMLAVYSIWQADRKIRPFLAALLLAAGGLIFANVVLRIPPGNEANFYHIAAVLLAIPAGGILRVIDRRTGGLHTSWGRGAVLLVLFLPTTILVVIAYLNRPAIPLKFEGENLVRTPDETGLSELYDWARERTAPQAVFVLDPRQRGAMVGNTAEFPAFSHRSMFTEHFTHYMVDAYPDARKRYGIAIQLVNGEELTDSDQQYLAGLSRAVYILIQDAENNQVMNLLERQYGLPVFHQDRLAVFRWQ